MRRTSLCFPLATVRRIPVSGLPSRLAFDYVVTGWHDGTNLNVQLQRRGGDLCCIRHGNRRNGGYHRPGEQRRNHRLPRRHRIYEIVYRQMTPVAQATAPV